MFDYIAEMFLDGLFVTPDPLKAVAARIHAAFPAYRFQAVPLQSLLYLAQIGHLRETDRTLFADPFLASPLGPRLPRIEADLRRADPLLSNQRHQRALGPDKARWLTHFCIRNAGISEVDLMKAVYDPSTAFVHGMRAYRRTQETGCREPVVLIRTEDLRAEVARIRYKVKPSEVAPAEPQARRTNDEAAARTASVDRAILPKGDYSG